ncbi:CAAX amino protease [Galliscardovia ingluviei]|uniref:CAAX amino protease n=1 Tax=Galliscardovia ingluviei TaxID=1769422 RepID=A0A8J3AM13_9BIFI|nr:Abi family protein [Galliscardovia ingluviei]GGI12828.1 CAAX amino protease [Galliscardovia ingluviei]
MSKKTNKRPALTAKEQCDHMAAHNIKFEKCSRQDAVKFLTENTYYFKLKAFDNNFYKNADNNYYNVDFANLQDIAALDFHLRSLILGLTGDIEHSLRIRFNNLISAYDDIDPYEVLHTYHQDQNAFYAKKNQSYKPKNEFCQSVYTQGMLDKYISAQPIWLFWETCTLNSLIQCYHSFLYHNNIDDIIYPLLFGMRLLRNAASHHNCLLVPSNTNAKKSIRLSQMLDWLIEDVPADDRTLVKIHVLSDILLHDFACVLLTHINLVRSRKIRDGRLHAMQSFINRLDKHKDWYQDETAHYKKIFVLRLHVMKILLMSVVRFYEKTDQGEISDSMTSLTALPIRRNKSRS